MQIKLIIFLFILCDVRTVYTVYDEDCVEDEITKRPFCKPVESTYEENEEYDTFVNTEIEKALKEYVPCENVNCTCHESVIFNDLKIFKDGITKEMVDSMLSKGSKYQIIKGKLYRSEKCHFPARCAGIEHYLTMIAADLPDMEMVINTRDWPQLRNHLDPAPIFSFSKDGLYHDIMYPAWSFWEGGPAIPIYPTGLGRWDKMRKSLMETAKKWPWSEKKSLAFFRGSRTHHERDQLVLLSRKYTNVAEAKYTRNQAWKNAMDDRDHAKWMRLDLTIRRGCEPEQHCVPEELRGLPMIVDSIAVRSPRDTLHAPPAPEATLEEHCQYKILVNYRGVAASFRLRHLFLCNSLVLQTDDEWLEFFYPSLKPWVHFVPRYCGTEEQLRMVLQYFLRHEDTARAIAQRGFEHVRDHLRDEDVQCYWRRLLQEYAKLLTYKVELDKDLVLIQR